MILTWLGIILAVGGILLGQVLEGGHLAQLLQPTAALIVFGGTIGATLTSCTRKEFIKALRMGPQCFFGKSHNYRPLIKELVTIANIARREGILALDKQLGQIQSPFLQHNLRHIIDGYDPNVLKEMMEEKMALDEEEKIEAANVFQAAGGFSPTMGIIGAVMGLIHVMSNLSDASKLGAGIAVAFVATIYGLVFANMFMLPMSNKLKKIAKQESLEHLLIYTALMGIQGGLNPRIVEEQMFNQLGEYSTAEGGGTAQVVTQAEKQAA